MGRRPAAKQGRNHRFDIQSGGESDSGGRQGVVDGEPAEAGYRGITPLAGRDEREPHPIQAGRLDRVGADVRVGGEAIAHHAGLRSSRHPADPLVVGVEHGDAVGWQCFNELALGFLDRLDRPDPRQVDRLDGRHDADLRPCHRGELGDLAAGVHPHLEDRGLVVWSEAHQRQGQADLVVLVALVLEGDQGRTEDRRDRLLGRGLGDAAGNPDDERIEACPPCGGDRVQSPERVVDLDDGDVRPGRQRRLGRPGDENRRGASGDRVGHEAVSVGPLARQGDEQVARHDLARVDGRARDQTGGTGEQPSR
jgi:hypothetical protein